MAAQIKIQQLSQKNLETQLGNLAQEQNTRPQGVFASDRENLKQVMAITLRTGRDIIDRPLNKNSEVQSELV